MNKSYKILTVLFCLLTAIITAQTNSLNCDCEATFKWLKTTFENNDAGFDMVLNLKGKDAYKKHNIKIQKDVKSAKTTAQCHQALIDWTRFFRRWHIGVQYVSNNASTIPNNTNPKVEVDKNRFEDWEKMTLDINAFKKRIQDKTFADYEGIWESGNYVVGIVKDAQVYKGFIIESNNPNWSKDQIKFTIRETAAQDSVTYYMGNHSPRKFEAILLDNNHLQFGFINFKRIFPHLEPNKSVERYFRLIEAKKPFFEQVDSHTVLIRIPSFSSSNKKSIDSVINANRQKILATPNLIIDIRNNGGGADRCYRELLPFIYTNPIRTVGVEFLSTRFNNKFFLDLSKDTSRTKEDRDWYLKSYYTLQERLGQYVNLNESTVSQKKLDTVYPYPKNVGILINSGNGSTSEQFLLAAKQSKKVKLFGHTTLGALDISNLIYADSPCGDFRLAYGASKSYRIPHMAIDDKGIQPDFYLDDSIPVYGWVDFIVKTFEDSTP